MSETLDLAIDLISRASVTPDDAGCQTLIAGRLAAIGFANEPMRFAEVDNLWSRRGSDGPLICFAGHTDVVPTGPREAWQSDPFKPEIRAGLLYGRGAADMKGSVAAMLVGIEQFVSEYPEHNGSIAMLLTSDEEGPAINGTVKVIETLQARGEKIDMCLVGEPSSTHRLGDVVKNGRRGSLGCEMTIQGIQGHVAYPHLADNPVHKALPALAELVASEWDQGNEFFPPTGFQISNIHAGTGATNVSPGILEVSCNFRYSTENSAEQLQAGLIKILDSYQLKYELQWTLSGLPSLTPAGALVDAAQQAIKDITGLSTELSTAGGTSDGRFIAPTGAQVLELGPLNATIHQVDECVSVDDLENASKIYQRLLELLLT